MVPLSLRGPLHGDTDHLEISPPFPRLVNVAATCAFCRRPHIGVYAVTSCRGDPEHVKSWGRGTLALCERCREALREAGDEGRVLKGTQHRWFLGHGVGPFASESAPR